MILKALFERIPAVLCQGSWDTDIASIAMCSKEVTNNSLFICIKGMEQDGHQYIQEAAERVAKACRRLWKRMLPVPAIASTVQGLCRTGMRNAVDLS